MIHPPGGYQRIDAMFLPLHLVCTTGSELAESIAKVELKIMGLCEVDSPIQRMFNIGSFNAM